MQGRVSSRALYVQSKALEADSSDEVQEKPCLSPRVVWLALCTSAVVLLVLKQVLPCRKEVPAATWDSSNKYTLNASHASLRDKSKPPLPLPNITLADHALRGAGSTGHDGWPSSAEARPGSKEYTLNASHTLPANKTLADYALRGHAKHASAGLQHHGRSSSAEARPGPAKIWPSVREVWQNRSSMFCFLVATEPEMPLIRWQFRHGAGLFGCSSWAVYSVAPAPLFVGLFPNGTEEWSTPIPGPAAFWGTQYFWGCDQPKKYLMNANIMVRAWEKTHEQGFAGAHSWIVKMDADTAMSAPRLRRLLDQVGHDKANERPGWFFKNCQVMNSMQGSLEIMSRQAFYLFAAKRSECQQRMDWWHMGEDIFSFHCLAWLGVKPMRLAKGLLDTYCANSSGCARDDRLPNCSVYHAAFHPLKTLDQYVRCWKAMEQVDSSKGLVLPRRA
ncbi:unnamed protein product [Effrenium voratum]|nr:unnamed protein product [Effrenium voratum]